MAVRWLFTSRSARRNSQRRWYPTPTLENGRKPTMSCGGVLIFCLPSRLTIDHASFSSHALIATPQKFVRSLRWICKLHVHRLLILSSFCFVVSGHNLSLGIAMISSLLSISVRKPIISHTINFRLPPVNTYIPFILVYFTSRCYVSPNLCCCVTRAHHCRRVLLLPTTGISAFLFTVGPNLLHEIVVLAYFRVIHWAVPILPLSNIVFYPPVYILVFLFFHRIS